MKLRNKKTGEIAELGYIASSDGSIILQDVNTEESIVKYVSLTELNEEWEDYEEAKDVNYWYIDDLGKVNFSSEINDEVNGTPNNISIHKVIGNYFDTREEAERAVEKLKAWKRLKDRGFKLSAVVDAFFCLDIFMKGEPYEAIKDDLKIVFGGEE